MNTQTIKERIKHWKQGDVTLGSGLEFVHMADLSAPCSLEAGRRAARFNVRDLEARPVPVTDVAVGLVVLTQTCDIVRACDKNPFVQVAPIIVLDNDRMKQVRNLMRYSFALIPNLQEDRMVADLDRVMTVEKPMLAKWNRLSGCRTDAEARDFAKAVARRFDRFAFPDDFVAAVKKLRKYFINKYERKTVEGALLRAVKEIRVQAEPSWSSNETRIRLTWWFIVDPNSPSDASDWEAHTNKWIGLFNTSGRYEINACFMRDTRLMSLRDYEKSVHLDLDRLSADRADMRNH